MREIKKALAESVRTHLRYVSAQPELHGLTGLQVTVRESTELETFVFIGRRPGATHMFSVRVSEVRS